MLGNITLLKHQVEILEHTKLNNKVAYYLDMGLGKTYIASEKLKTLEWDITLLVCQKSKLDDWLDHFKKYYEWPVEIYSNKTIIEPKKVIIINYDLLWRRKYFLELNKFRWTLILDESQYIKNETSKRSKFILKKLTPYNILLLSGTPTGGKYEQLWSQCRLLGWNIDKKIYWQQYVEVEFKEDIPTPVVTGYKNVDRLKKKLRDYGAVFLKTSDVLDLPKQTFVRLSIKTPKHYYKFKKDRVVNIDGEEFIGDHPTKYLLYQRYLANAYNDNKLDALSDLIESTEDRIIIFYQFNNEFEAISRIIEDVGRPVSVVNGKTKDLSNYEIHDDSITLVQYQAGASGLNLQLANKIIYFSLTFSCELYEQSAKRIHRIGQEDACFYYLLLTRNSIDEKILETLEKGQSYNLKLFLESEA